MATSSQRTCTARSSPSSFAAAVVAFRCRRGAVESRQGASPTSAVGCARAPSTAVVTLVAVLPVLSSHRREPRSTPSATLGTASGGPMPRGTTGIRLVTGSASNRYELLPRGPLDQFTGHPLAESDADNFQQPYLAPRPQQRDPATRTARAAHARADGALARLLAAAGIAAAPARPPPAPRPVRRARPRSRGALWRVRLLGRARVLRTVPVGSAGLGARPSRCSPVVRARAAGPGGPPPPRGRSNSAGARRGALGAWALLSGARWPPSRRGIAGVSVLSQRSPEAAHIFRRRRRRPNCASEEAALTPWLTRHTWSRSHRLCATGNWPAPTASSSSRWVYKNAGWTPTHARARRRSPRRGELASAGRLLALPPGCTPATR